MTKARLAAMVLVIQGMVTGLAVPVLLAVDDSQPTLAALAAGTAVALIVAAGLVRKPLGIWLGWALQAGLLVLSIWSLPLLFLTLVFAGIWVVALRVGGRIDREGFRPADDAGGGS